MKTRTHNRTLVVCLFTALSLLANVWGQDSSQQISKPKHHTYKLIDLGTFGGPNSFLYIPDSYAQVLNNRGTVVGFAGTPDADPYPNFCFDPDCQVARAFRSQGHGKTDLGTLPSTVPVSSQPNWIAENGLIAGVSENGVGDPLNPGFPELHAVLWQREGITDLGTLGGGSVSFAAAVNNSAHVVGFSTNTIQDDNAILGLGFQVRAFLWQNGAMQDLGTLGGTNAFAFLINQRGQIVGASYTSADPSARCANAFGFALATGAFLWENGTMKNLGSFGGSCTVPTDINDRGQIVGDSTFPGDQMQHAFLWEHGVMRDLGNSFGGLISAAIAINQAGHVVGSGRLPGNSVRHAALWKNGVQIDLGALGAGDCSISNSINSQDQIVGQSFPNCDFNMPGSAFLFENSGIVDLNALIPAGSSLFLSEPGTINDRGEITGIGITVDGDEHAFLLVPDGECDANCEARIAAGQKIAAPIPAQPRIGLSNATSLRSRFGRLGGIKGGVPQP